MRLLVAVWGERHARLFLDYALPSLLAANNIPLLAGHFQCDFEFLTMTEDFERFSGSEAVRELSAFSRVHFTAIDDLKLGNSYGTLLTCAFARGIAARGAEMTDTTFVFLNADFVFSDGSLAAMLNALRKGHRAVMVPSFRCASEDFTERFPVYPAGRRGTGAALSVSSRDLVRLALDHIHPTFAAKTVNLGGPFTTLVNQFLWKVDENTMLGRFYLLFMLCVRPEVPLDEVIGFCDYVLVPQLVPSGKVEVLTDSDDAFLLELQDRAHEGGEHLVSEPPGPAFLAERLSEWTTPLHRQYARHDLLFHAADLPGKLDQARDEARIFVDSITARLGPPCPYRVHRYWKSTFAALKVDPDGVPVFRDDTSAEEGQADLAGLVGDAATIANLRRIRNRMSARIQDLRMQVNNRDAELAQLVLGRALRFDPEFYRRSNPDVVASGADPERHYRAIGWKRGSDPSPYFSVTGYLAENPDVRLAGLEPWDHFCRYGSREGRTGWRKSFLEDEPLSLPRPDERLPRAPQASRGWFRAIFRRWFDRPDGDRELILDSGLFDPAYYVANNPDVAAAGDDPLDHYMTRGAREGRRPSNIFDGRAYLERNPDVKAAGLNPIVHWMRHGRYEDRPSPLSVETRRTGQRD